MIIQLDDTSTREVAQALIKARRNVGSASGMVMTLMVVSDEEHREAALTAARASAMAHPSRVLVVTWSDEDRNRLDAEIQVGEGIPGDLVLFTVGGALKAHVDSILRPLLLPDSPVIAWWPHDAPLDVAEDPIGRLANRRITDAAGSEDPPSALRERARNHTPGDTDLTWTRLTRWRGLLAVALDQHPEKVLSGTVTAAKDNAPAALLAAWLENGLGVEITLETNGLPGVSKVCLVTASGTIEIDRGRSENIAHYKVPGEPERKVALKRRPLTDLLTEELQRLDPDFMFEAAVSRLARRVSP